MEECENRREKMKEKAKIEFEEVSSSFCEENWKMAMKHVEKVFVQDNENVWISDRRL